MKNILDNMKEVVVVSKMTTTDAQQQQLFGGRDVEILYINEYYKKLA